MNCMDEFLLCPRCRGKTRIRVRTSTVLKDFPLSCPKCRYECIIDCEKGKVTAQRIQETQEAAPASCAGGLHLLIMKRRSHGKESYDRRLRAGLRKM